MPKRLGLWIGVFGVVLALPAAASAARFVSSEISLEASASASDIGPPEMSDSASDSLVVSDRRVFDEEVLVRADAGNRVDATAIARLAAAFDPSRIAIEGVAQAVDGSPGGSAGGTATVTYRLDFEVDERAPYAFDITLSTGGFFAAGTNIAQLALSESVAGDVFRLELVRNDDFLRTTESGFLDPGLYSLELFLEGSGGFDEASHSGRATVEGMIPEPGTGLLVAAGLLGLGRVGRRS